MRIIAGKWRGRRLRFPPSTDIRPTPDRVRETLFNWISASVVGASALDLFAGSGALGLEALSRGAAFLTFVEREAAAANALEHRLTEWGETHAQVARADALEFLSGPARPMQLVFLDPPFHSPVLPIAAARLESGGWLDAGALVYVESSAQEPLPELPARWRPTKAKRAGAVGYHLFTRE